MSNYECNGYMCCNCTCWNATDNNMIVLSSRKVYANVRNIILKHIFITRSFVFITTSGNLLFYSLCYEDNFP